ncbi:MULTISPECIES: RnfABCDGE type electron transport complex subunit D [Ruminococcus]|uniref:Electron transport complex, RnfABCDGE type, D subunit n=1 Tax=Ruminococcus albus (strain ATCC 27210 / DSM 20455 / JCM 14654 / NCDO 2250 / 7) TaxID=697329 RepID=E6UCA3_RUMA7|nr:MULTISPECIES: RnfABCDGE type electron transport complex subunit D [Ruminococcus]ADU20695.1 electron transport complex, RnfABCDGE type, D subunit [Ruminococcus albus 7 = DSM 20455]MCR5021402.1 RnfABCDGE type electron transport complex subunit D [Ruminococcus sp.]
MTDFRPEIAELKQFSAPYIKEDTSVSKIMTHVMVGLLPSLILSGILFGGSALLLTGFCILTSLLWEFIICLILKRKNSINDLSAAVTGMIFAYMLPTGFPFWQAAIGTFIAIVVFKHLFGGLGKNIFNPAVASRLVCWFIFRSSFIYYEPDVNSADMPSYGELSLMSGVDSYGDMFLGRVCGGLGEVSVIALLTGAFYLVSMRVISLYEPAAFLGTIYLFSAIAGKDGLYQILAGGTVLAAFFLCCDTVTTPSTNIGKIIFGIAAGFLTCVFRFFTDIPQGLLFAILICNLLTIVIDRVTETAPGK